MTLLLEDLKHSYVGRRIQLVQTVDPYTNLKAGDKGTVTYVSKILDDISIGVKWDTGSSMSLIYGKDDFKILD